MVALISLNPDELKIDKEPYIYESPLEGVLLIRRPRYADQRGSFQEEARLPDIGDALHRDVKIAQSQYSESAPRVIRGIHFEPQDKLVTPLTGKISVVLLDLRVGSPTFKRYLMFELDNTQDKAKTTIFIPEGVGNSFCVHKDSPTVIYQYSVTCVYNPATAGMGVRYDDEELAIPWPVDDPIVSDRDLSLPTMEEFLNARKS